MKKVIAAVLASATLFCFTSCGTAICSFCGEENKKSKMEEMKGLEDEYICEDCLSIFKF